MKEDELPKHRQQAEGRTGVMTGLLPSLDDMLLYIGIFESGIPPKTLTENEKSELRDLAVCAILVPARYYELFWVEDTGWPHYKQLKRLPPLNAGEREAFLRKYILLYAEKNLPAGWFAG